MNLKLYLPSEINERLPHPSGALLLLGSVETGFLVGRSPPQKIYNRPSESLYIMKRYKKNIHIAL